MSTRTTPPQKRLAPCVASAGAAVYGFIRPLVRGRVRVRGRGRGRVRGRGRGRGRGRVRVSPDPNPNPNLGAKEASSEGKSWAERRWGRWTPGVS